MELSTVVQAINAHAGRALKWATRLLIVPVYLNHPWHVRESNPASLSTAILQTALRLSARASGSLGYSITVE